MTNSCFVCLRTSKRSNLYEVSEGKYLCTCHYFLWFSDHSVTEDPNLTLVG